MDNLTYESDKEDSFNPAMIGSVVQEPSYYQPEEEKTAHPKKWILIIAAAVILIGSGLAAFLIFRNKGESSGEEKIPEIGAGYETKEDVVSNLFRYISEGNSEGIDSCFPSRDILSETEAKIVDMVITTLSAKRYAYDYSTYKVSFNDDDLHFLYEEDITVEFEATSAVVTMDVQNPENGKNSNIQYDVYLIKTDKWFVIEVGTNDDELLDEVKEISSEEKKDVKTDPLATGKISIDGNEYTIPFQYSELKAAFEIEHEEDMIDGGGRNTYLVGKDGKHVMVTVSELLGRDTPARDCHVVGIYAEDPEFPVTIPGGGTIGMTPQEIESRYGQPDAIYGSQDKTYKYEFGISGSEHFSMCKIVFHFKDGKEVANLQYSFY